jgi:hypothetical protein
VGSRVSGLALASQVAQALYVQRTASLNVHAGGIHLVVPLPPHE